MTWVKFMGMSKNLPENTPSRISQNMASLPPLIWEATKDNYHRNKTNNAKIRWVKGSKTDSFYAHVDFRCVILWVYLLQWKGGTLEY